MRLPGSAMDILHMLPLLWKNGDGVCNFVIIGSIAGAPRRLLHLYHSHIRSSNFIVIRTQYKLAATLEKPSGADNMKVLPCIAQSRSLTTRTINISHMHSTLPPTRTDIAPPTFFFLFSLIYPLDRKRYFDCESIQGPRATAIRGDSPLLKSLKIKKDT